MPGAHRPGRNQDSASLVPQPPHISGRQGLQAISSICDIVSHNHPRREDFQVKRIALGAALFQALAIQALSQTTGTGTIIGTATDPSGAVVPAAKIGLQDIATGVVRSSMTNSSGQYS